MDSLAFLGSASRKLQPIYVLHGDENFLKRQVLAALRARVFGADGDEFGYSAQRLTYPARSNRSSDARVREMGLGLRHSALRDRCQDGSNRQGKSCALSQSRASSKFFWDGAT